VGAVLDRNDHPVPLVGEHDLGGIAGVADTDHAGGFDEAVPVIVVLGRGLKESVPAGKERNSDVGMDCVLIDQKAAAIGGDAMGQLVVAALVDADRAITRRGSFDGLMAADQLEGQAQARFGLEDVAGIVEFPAAGNFFVFMGIATQLDHLGVGQRPSPEGDISDVDFAILAIIVGEEQHLVLQSETAIEILLETLKEKFAVEEVVEELAVPDRDDEAIPLPGVDLEVAVAGGGDADLAVGIDKEIPVIAVAGVGLQKGIPLADFGDLEIELHAELINVGAAAVGADARFHGVVAARPDAYSLVLC